jgi:site-specific recombinase XerD
MEIIVIIKKFFEHMEKKFQSKETIRAYKTDIEKMVKMTPGNGLEELTKAPLKHKRGVSQRPAELAHVEFRHA